ncbi:MAG: DUF4974 domain-containing protein [Niabella sp.]
MPEQLAHIQALIQKIKEGAASAEEWDALLRWIDSEEGYQHAYWVAASLGIPGTDANLQSKDDEKDDEGIVDNIFRQANDLQHVTFHQPEARRRKMKERFPVYRIAAVIILVILTGGIYTGIKYGKAFRQKDLAATAVTKGKTNAIAPGTNKAMLILADGSSVSLDSASGGIIAEQGNSRIEKTADGSIAYTTGGKIYKAHVIEYNTLSVPNGGQYFVALPDGTKVWLNAASSLKYPVVFSGAERVVYLEGEAYFEVAVQMKKNGKERMPFIVNVVNHLNPASNAKVEVLGTHFNVEAYPEDQKIKTTLLEGKVNFYASPGAAATSLMPGYQAVHATTGNEVVLHKTDVNEAIAWKNGFFDFNRMNLTDVLLQLSRWYNVSFEYKGEVPDIIFYGKMQRSLYLNEVLDALQMQGVHFKIEHRNRLIVMP